MSTIAEVFRMHAPGFLAKHGERLPTAHRKVIRSILDCRTEALGLLHFRCSECGTAFELHRSCGNRHCPTCGKAKGKAWLDKRLGQLLPVPHFMITFTVPAVFRSLFLHHQRLCYTALFQASSSVLRRLASESTYFPGDTSGFFGVLHTWGRTLSYHPHIHYIVPAGAFDSHTHRWHPCPTAFYAPVRVLSKLVKARMFAMLTRAALAHELPPGAFGKDWNVDSRPVGKGVRALRYLSAYVFRTAISDKRLLQITDRTVTFAYTDTTTGRHKQMTLSAEEFIRRFLQHVLPTGFIKIRYYGFLHPSSAIPLKLAVTLLEAFTDLRPPRHREPTTTGTLAPFCPACNATAVLLFYSQPSRTPTATAGFT
jgi:hypothetical protein